MSAEQMGDAKAETVRNCTRIFLELMFTQIGVGCLLVSYTVLGAIAFQYLETVEVGRGDGVAQAEAGRASTVAALWATTRQHNTLEPGRWRSDTTEIIRQYEAETIGRIQAGWDGSTLQVGECGGGRGLCDGYLQERWTFPSALMFALSVITMIGYGNLVPTTRWGKILTIVSTT